MPRFRGYALGPVRLCQVVYSSEMDNIHHVLVETKQERD